MADQALQSKRAGPGDPSSRGAYDILFKMTTQMLAMESLKEGLLLALDTITADLGFPCAAIALIDERNANLSMEMADGFPDNRFIELIEMPLDSGEPQIAIIHSGRPAWISAESGERADVFLNKMGPSPAIVALPLFGGRSPREKREVDLARKPLPGISTEELAADTDSGQKYWAPEAVCFGALYVGSDQVEASDSAMEFLVALADHLGIALSTAIKIDAMNAATAELQRERHWVEWIMESVADPIVLTNLDNEILLQNRRAEELFSERGQASEGKRRALKMNDLLFSAYLSSATVSSTEVVGRDLVLVDPIEGSDTHFEVVSTPALNELGEGIGLVSVFRDVTDLRRANEELARNYAKLQQAEAEARRESDRLNLVIENVGHPVVVTDSGGNFILFNRRAEALFQQKVGAAQPADVLFDQQDPSTSRVLAAIRANSVKLTSFISGLASETRTGRQAEIELIDPETGDVLPMEITSVEVLDSKGQVTAVVSILHDLSEIRELERRRVEQQLFESEKLAAIGTLAASIAHEVNNPLEAIKNSIYLLRSSEDGESRDRFLQIAFKETERVSRIIRQMLGFARRSGAVEWVNLNQLLDEILALVARKMQHSGIRIHLEFEKDLPEIHAFGDQLRQVFLNLILNAQQSLERGGKIHMRTMRYKASLQPSVSFEITDTGGGISEDDLARIFEPFFSTRKDGTGLGLWVTQNIVRQHGGRIDVRSSEGKGTTFQLILPVDPPAMKTEGLH
jgi:signal transduction histidine kinase